MESPIEVVRRFCAAWSDNMGAVELAAFFAEDAIYHNIPQEPVTGRENIANTIASVLRPGPPGIEGIDFRVINIAANGPGRDDRAGGRLQAPLQVVRAAGHGHLRGQRRQDQRVAGLLISPARLR
jgi:hypothetical protein